jgi:hypothetical protein
MSPSLRSRRSSTSGDCEGISTRHRNSDTVLAAGHGYRTRSRRSLCRRACVARARRWRRRDIGCSRSAARHGGTSLRRRSRRSGSSAAHARIWSVVPYEGVCSGSRSGSCLSVCRAHSPALLGRKSVNEFCVSFTAADGASACAALDCPQRLIIRHPLPHRPPPPPLLRPPRHTRPRPPPTCHPHRRSADLAPCLGRRQRPCSRRLRSRHSRRAESSL